MWIEIQSENQKQNIAGLKNALLSSGDHFLCSQNEHEISRIVEKNANQIKRLWSYNSSNIRFIRSDDKEKEPIQIIQNTTVKKCHVIAMN